MPPRITTFAPGDDLSALDQNFIHTLHQAAGMHLVSNMSWGSWEGDHGLHRFAWLANLIRPGSAHTTFIVDSKEDWRDRLIALWGFADSGAAGYGSVFPGSPHDTAFGQAFLGSFYTNNGQVAGQTVTGVMELATGLYLYADQTTGHLCLDLHSTAADGQYSIGLILSASEGTGQRGGAGQPVVPGILAANGNPVYPADLNRVQDEGMLLQAQQGETEIRSLPVGGVKFGDPSTADVWTRRDGTQARQPLTGEVRRFFSTLVPGNTTQRLDDSVDWRDRFLIGQGRFSNAAAAIQPGGAAATSHNSATHWFGGQYLGPGNVSYAMTVAPNLLIFAEESNGELAIFNQNGGDYVVTGMLRGTFPLGPRSVKP